MSNKSLCEAVDKIYEAIAEAERIADETGESFGIDIAYGMGGYYEPTEEHEDIGGHWFPSSLSC